MSWFKWKKKDIYSGWSKKELKEEIYKLKQLYNALFDKYVHLEESVKRQ